MPRTVEGNVVVERILAMRRKGETDAEFAGRLGVSPQQLSNWKAKTPDLPISTLLKMLSATGADPRAILWEEGAEDWPEELRDELGRTLLDALRGFWRERGLGAPPRPLVEGPPDGALDVIPAPRPGEKKKRRGGLGD